MATYACHYCERTDGAQTRDHKLPRMFGGTGLRGNIVRCCRMCNSIKGARSYDLFVVFFQQFLEVHGEEYRTGNPDDWDTVGTMARKFNAWLHGLQHADGGVTKFEGV
jgi:HNH endonuclease